MAGWLTVEEAEEQIEAASDKYLYAETDGDYILQDRFDALNVLHTFEDNSVDFNTSSAYNSKGDYIGEVYAGGNAVVLDMGDQWGNTTAFTQQVLYKINDIDDYPNPDAVYTRGGPIPGAGQGFPDTADWTGYVDSLFLAEASKVTGEKWF